MQVAKCGGQVDKAMDRQSNRVHACGFESAGGVNFYSQFHSGGGYLEVDMDLGRPLTSHGRKKARSGY